VALQLNCNTENFKKMELSGNALQAKAPAKLETNDPKIDKDSVNSNKDDSESKLYGQT
jgi:hypothetical protein